MQQMPAKLFFKSSRVQIMHALRQPLKKLLQQPPKRNRLFPDSVLIMVTGNMSYSSLVTRWCTSQRDGAVWIRATGDPEVPAAVSDSVLVTGWWCCVGDRLVVLCW